MLLWLGNAEQNGADISGAVSQMAVLSLGPVAMRRESSPGS